MSPAERAALWPDEIRLIAMNASNDSSSSSSSSSPLRHFRHCLPPSCYSIQDILHYNPASPSSVVNGPSFDALDCPQPPPPPYGSGNGLLDHAAGSGASITVPHLGEYDSVFFRFIIVRATWLEPMFRITKGRLFISWLVREASLRLAWRCTTSWPSRFPSAQMIGRLRKSIRPFVEVSSREFSC